MERDAFFRCVFTGVAFGTEFDEEDEFPVTGGREGIPEKESPVAKWRFDIWKERVNKEIIIL